VGGLQRLTSVTRFPAVYRLWQAPFVQDKLAPLLRRDEIAHARRVLDVGCGPGTNAPEFAHAEYVGIDISESYIETARRKHSGTFHVTDVRTYRSDAVDRFDFVLVNSLLHHLDTPSVTHILNGVREQLTEDGCVHILELVLPQRRSVSHLLARLDRGDYPRPLEKWRGLFQDVFEELVFEPYVVGRCGVALWDMIYFKGRAPQ
jgi:SAM-dependent methyltransferase